MQGQHSKQSSFFGMIYEELSPADHLLRKLSAAVDLSLVSETVSVMPGVNAPQCPPLSADLGFASSLGLL